jgi:hypothetical protein
MYNVYALLVAGAVLAAAGTALAGEPTGRYQGAEGSAPQGIEQSLFANSGTARGGYVTASAVNDGIPASQDLAPSAVAVRSLGRGGDVVTANIPGSVNDEIQFATRVNEQLALRQ